MIQWPLDFKDTKRTAKPHYYDLIEDWELIVSSFAQQYGIRLLHEHYMPWSEMSILLAGINHKTPLGIMISIRSETDQERLKAFTPEQRKIRNDWLSSQSKKLIKNNPDEALRQVMAFEKAMTAAFGGNSKSEKGG